MLQRLSRAALALAIAAHAGLGIAQSGLIELGPLNGGPPSTRAVAVSGDGTVVVGWASDGAAENAQRAFRWTQAGGMASLGVLDDGLYSYARDVNADGTVVVGTAGLDTIPGPRPQAFRWTPAAGMVSLGTLNGGPQYSYADSVTPDGRVVVGLAIDGATGENHMFRWTQETGMVSLGYPLVAGAVGLEPRRVSADGSVIVGRLTIPGIGYSSLAFRWAQATGMVSLGSLNGGTSPLTGALSSTALDVNADGSVVVGGASDGAAGNAGRAFGWTPAGGMVSLGVLNGGYSSLAMAVSADGNVIVGEANDGRAGNVRRAFRWTQASGMQTIEDWLRANGVTIAQDMSYSAADVSADGSVVVGELMLGEVSSANSRSFLARVSPYGNGLVTLADVQDSLGAAAAGARMALSAAGTVLNGAHSRPLARRVAAGQNAFWLAGDWGQDDHGARSGDLGLAEVGIGRHFGPLQANVALGQTWAKQALVLNGRAEAKGTYLLAEGLMSVSGNLWATVGGYAHWGEADLRRTYLNAGVLDASTGRPDGKTWGLRARLDWENAVSLGGTNLTPYADLSHSKTRLEGYTETGGGFPARFDARREKATEMRVGANTSRPLWGAARLLGGLEAAHRFERSGARTSGQIIGLFGFDLAGSAYDRDWVRANVGIEGKLGGGTGSLMLNVTTKGETPDTWLAAAWQTAF